MSVQQSARVSSPGYRLGNGDVFPLLQLAAVGGGTISLPADLAGSFGVVLVYRGSWCPYCNAQLAAFGRAEDKLVEVGAKVVALSVDDEATSTALVAKHHLGFPTGAFTNTDPPTCSPPGSCWPLMARCSPRCTPAALSDGWCPMTSWAC